MAAWSPGWRETTSFLAGYVVGGGPFTYITSTFNVPTITASTAQTTDIAIWDGFQNSAGSQILQAGVAAGSYDLVGGAYYWYAWYYDSTNGNPVEGIPVAVNAGDTVSVTLYQVSGQTWAIEFTNDTTGRSSTTDQTWTQTSSTAEWDVESPPTSPTASDLTSYSGAVSFRGMALIGTQTGAGEWLMSQPDGQSATPSALTSSGFSITDA
ncbi:MAG: G1 family glutamic endopeptidase [Candidatus Dormibacteria bacterium]